jgi:formylglycine-generating enzyme
MNDQEPLNTPSQSAGASPLPPPAAPSSGIVEQTTVLAPTPAASAPMALQESSAIPASRKPGRGHPGLTITAVVLALLSFAGGLGLFSYSRTGPPADRHGPGAVADGSGSATTTAPGDNRGPATNNSWAQVIAALTEKPAESQNTNIAPKANSDRDPHAPEPDPQPEPPPLPPESIRFAGKQAGDEYWSNCLLMRFCWCPPGRFLMGSPPYESDRQWNYSDEHQIEVTLTRGFWLGRYETTQDQWQKVMGTRLVDQLNKLLDKLWWDAYEAGQSTRGIYNHRGPTPNFGEGPNYPMYYVSHLEATEFCRKLTERERQEGRLPPGWEYRLPTEAQWEYACRAGTTTATAFGDKLSSNQANFDGNFPYFGAQKGPSLRRTQPVGMYAPNGWGFYDMPGNVQEWCRDWFSGLPGGTDPEVKFGDVSRVVRDGSWRCAGRICRSANRTAIDWSDRSYDIGFRVAIVLDPKPKAPQPEPDPRPLPERMLVNSIGMQLAAIPAGKFLMGSPENEPGRPGRGRDEVDYEWQHPVTVREPFYLGVYLVTQEQYQQTMGNSPAYRPSYFSREGEGKDKVQEFEDTGKFPRENVSWEEAQEFCRRLSDLPEEKRWKRVYRLPTEAEWEYACRAGTSTPYYLGTDITPGQANFGNRLGRTTPVGYYNNPNMFGLYDMHGNLLEFCQDLYAPYEKDLRDPNKLYSKVLRGGYWGIAGAACRCASRYEGGPANMISGFRVVLSVAPRPRSLTAD